jgi:hypothetical protein
MIQGIDSESMSDEYPIRSKSWLLFYGPTDSEEESNKREYQALLLPEYNKPKIVGMNSNDTGSYK